jgi:hypothetical protein
VGQVVRKINDAHGIRKEIRTGTQEEFLLPGTSE